VVGLVMRNRHMAPRLLKIGAVGLFAFFLVANLANLNLVAIAEDFADGFSFNDPSNEAAYDRRLQFDALLAEWHESPLIGHGHGAAGAVMRDPEQPWAYELSYLALLFHTGLIGLAVYSIAVIWLVMSALKIVRHEQKLALVVGCMVVGLYAFLIANATNPYLAKFDYLWTIFVLAAAVNVASCKRPVIRSSLRSAG